MLFITKEKSFYELLREYLIDNSLMNEDLNLAVFNSALLVRSQELGFKDLESYCRYVMILPFIERLKEVRLLVPNYNPLFLYQNGNQLKELSQSLVAGLIDSAGKASGSQDEEGVRWLTKVLTKPIELRKTEDETTPLRLLFPECGEAEDVYSMGFRLKTILSKEIKPEIIATDSNASFLDKARKGEFHPGKVAQLPDNYRSLYVEKNKAGFYKVTDSVKDLINFRKFNIFISDLDPEYYSYFHIISCNNIVKFYPEEISEILLKKMIKYLAPGGFLFVNFPDGQKESFSEYLELMPLGGTYVYRRNSEQIPEEEIEKVVKITPSIESLENRLIHLRGVFLDGMYDRSKKLIEEILNDHIDNLVANEFKGDIYIKLEEYPKALLQYRKALLINSSFLGAHFNSSALLYKTGEKEMAIKHLDDINQKMEKVDEELLINYFDINKESFLLLTDELRKIIDEGQDIDFNKLRETALELKATDIEIPKIEVPDPFKRRSSSEHKEYTSSMAPEMPPGEKKVVNIAELPSTRDYGEHDPWKKKMQELEERRKRGEIIEEEAEPAQGEESPGTQLLIPQTQELPPLQEKELPGVKRKKKKNDKSTVIQEEEEEEEIDYKLPKSMRMLKPSEKKGKKKPKRKTKIQEKRKTRKSSKKPAKTKLFLKPLAPDDLSMADEEEEEFEDEFENEEEFEDEEEFEEEDEFEEEEDKPVRKPLRNLQLSLRRPTVEKEIIKVEVCLPPELLEHLDLLLIREDPLSIYELLKAYEGKVSPGQLDLLRRMEKIIQVSLATRKPEPEKKQYKGKLKESHEQILKIKESLKNKNLLEASIMFQQLINSGAAIEHLRRFQRKRIKGIKNEIEKKMEKYQNFIDQYFTNPIEVFQKDLWEILAELTPKENLEEMGKKYGLDPQYLKTTPSFGAAVPAIRTAMPTVQFKRQPKPSPDQLLEEVTIPSPVGEIDPAQKDNQMLDSLAKIDFFESLTREELVKVAQHLKLIFYNKDQEIIRQGDPGEVFYIIKSGSVSVTSVDENGELYLRKMLRQGNYFGEISLLIGEPRTASVTALEDVELYLLNKTDFRSILKEFPLLDEKISEKIAFRQKISVEKIEMEKHRTKEEATQRAQKKLNVMSKDFLNKIRTLFPKE